MGATAPGWRAAAGFFQDPGLSSTWGHRFAEKPTVRFLWLPLLLLVPAACGGDASQLEEPRQSLAGAVPTIRSRPAEDLTSEKPPATDRLRFGLCVDLTGPLSEFGDRYLSGLRMALYGARIDGKQVELVVESDWTSPSTILGSVRRMRDRENVIALVGGHGSPFDTFLPQEAGPQLPWFAPAWGSAVIVGRPGVHHLRASIEEEVEVLASLIASDRRRSKDLVVCTQRNAFGEEVYSGLVQALAQRGIETATIRHLRCDVQGLRIAEQVTELLGNDITLADCVSVLPQGITAKLLRQLRAQRLVRNFYSVSTASAELLLRELGALAEGVVCTQVVPVPLPAADWREELDAGVGDPSALEGYLTGKLMLGVLKELGPNVPMDKLRSALAAAAQKHEGFKGLVPDNRQVRPGIWLATVSEGRLQALDAGGRVR